MSTAPNSETPKSPTAPVIRSTQVSPSPPSETPNSSVAARASDVLADLGGIPVERLLSGGKKASDVADLSQWHRSGNSCELVDGYVVERAMGYRESLIAAVLIEFLSAFVRIQKLGMVSGPDGFFRLSPTLVRGPDVAFISWDRLPDRTVPTEAFPAIVPELVVEVIREGNTRTEMTNKRREYFGRGVQLIWIVDPDQRSVAVWRSMTEYQVLDESQTLDGENVLPGLAIPLMDVFKVLNGPGEISDNDSGNPSENESENGTAE